MVTNGLNVEEFSSIECIPRELFWMVIEFAPEVVHHLKMVRCLFFVGISYYGWQFEFANFLMLDC